MALTYEPIATTTLGSNGTFTFSSIPNTYTDLRVVVVATATSNASSNIQFNGDTATNYSGTYVSGNGASTFSGSNSGQTYLSSSRSGNWNTTTPFFHTMDIFSYAGSTNKTVLITNSQDNNGGGVVERIVGLWRSTSAITSIAYTAGATLKTGTTATLYGIKSA